MPSSGLCPRLVSPWGSTAMLLPCPARPCAGGSRCQHGSLPVGSMWPQTRWTRAALMSQRALPAPSPLTERRPSLLDVMLGLWTRLASRIPFDPQYL